VGLDTAGSVGATFATADGWLAIRTGCGSGTCGADATAVRGVVALTADGCGSSATGFASFVDVAGELGRREVWRVCGSGGSSGSEAAAVLSAGSVLSSACVDDSVELSGVASSRSASADHFGRLGFDAFGAASLVPAVLSDVEVSPDGDGSSARAIPLPNPTATQADSTKTATVSRNHQ